MVFVSPPASVPKARLYDSIVESLGDGRSTFGTIACHTASALGFDDAARKAVRVLATQIGLVISGQAIAQRGHRVADRLQRALLPEHLPEIPGAKFYAAYRPASDEAEVGGDWFDAFHSAWTAASRSPSATSPDTDSKRP